MKKLGLLLLLATSLLSGCGSGSYVGREAPDFTYRTLDGKKEQFSALRGKVVILDFWATWCGPCIGTMPTIDRMAKEYGKDGVVAIGVTEEDEETIREFLKVQDVKYPLVRNAGDAAMSYDVSGIPRLFVIGKNGQILLDETGAPINEEKVRQAIVKGLAQ